MRGPVVVVVFVATVALLAVVVDGYNVPPTGLRSVSDLDNMIRQCFQTLCKEWMAECHWYCDTIKGASFMRRCKDCLSWRGEQCMDCFDL